MRNIPINLGGYRLMISEAPTMKTRKGKDGTDEVVTDNDGVTKFVVSLFAKVKGQKGEEIKVTLSTDPGESFDEGDLVELVGATASPYSFKNDAGETVAGVAFSAAGLKPLG
jgi:phage tail sheath gpL-like